MKEETKKSKFCVVTTPRSGSTWLSTLLNSHPQIKAFEEPFTWRKERPNWREDNFPTYYNFYQNSTSLKLPGIRSPWILFKYLDLLDSYKAEKDFELIGFKMMYSQILKDPGILLRFILDRYKIVHLVRENFLDILISRTIMKQCGVAHSNQLSANKFKSKTKQAFLEPSSLIESLSRLEKNSKLVRSFLKFMPIKIIEIKYESLVENQDQVLCSLANFLEVDSIAVTFNSELKKLNPEKYKDKIANYDQVLETLEGSKYAKFLLN